MIVFCRKDRVPRALLIGGASWQEQKDMVTAIEMTDGIKAFDNFFPRNALFIRIIGGKPRFEIEMKGLDVRRITSVGDALIDASEYSPRAVHMAFFYLPPREGAARNISVALRNCI